MFQGRRLVHYIYYSRAAGLGTVNGRFATSNCLQVHLDGNTASAGYSRSPPMNSISVAGS